MERNGAGTRWETWHEARSFHDKNVVSCAAEGWESSVASWGSREDVCDVFHSESEQRGGHRIVFLDRELVS